MLRCLVFSYSKEWVDFCMNLFCGITSFVLVTPTKKLVSHEDERPINSQLQANLVRCILTVYFANVVLNSFCNIPAGGRRHVTPLQLLIFVCPSSFSRKEKSLLCHW